MKIFGYLDDLLNWFIGLPLWMNVLGGIILLIIFYYFYGFIKGSNGPC